MFGFGSKTIESASGLVEKTGNALDSLFTSDEERQAGQVVLNKIKQNPEKWAHELNVLNAKNASLFVSGARPAILWVCVLSLFMFFVPQYVMASFVWFHACFDAMEAGNALPLYPVGVNGIWELVTVVLGGKAIRSYDKTVGVARS